MILTKFTFDPDLGWHLVMGGRFLKLGEILYADQFSWTMPGYLWGNSYFLYQIIVAYLFEHVSFIFLQIIFGVCAALAFLIVLPKKIDYWVLIFTFLAATVATVNMGVRPHTASLLLFAVLLKFIDKNFFSARWDFLIWFGLFALWANVHRGFVMGLVVLGAFLALDIIWHKKSAKQSIIFPRVLSFAGAIAGTFFTPFPLALWRSAVFVDLTNRHNLTTVAEWQSSAIYFPANLLLSVSGIIFVAVLIKNFSKVDPRWFITGAILFVFAFIAVNFLLFWSLAFVYIVARNFDFRIKPAHKIIKFSVTIATLMVFLTIFLNFAETFVSNSTLAAQLDAGKYPVGAVNYIKESRNWERLFNDYNWGGYLIWQLSESRVFIDGRMASWKRSDSKSILLEYTKIARGDCRLLESYSVETVLVAESFANNCFSNWNLVYSDSVAKILTKP